MDNTSVKYSDDQSAQALRSGLTTHSDIINPYVHQRQNDSFFVFIQSKNLVRDTKHWIYKAESLSKSEGEFREMSSNLSFSIKHESTESFFCQSLKKGSNSDLIYSELNLLQYNYTISWTTTECQFRPFHSDLSFVTHKPIYSVLLRPISNWTLLLWYPVVRTKRSYIIIQTLSRMKSMMWKMLMHGHFTVRAVEVCILYTQSLKIDSFGWWVWEFLEVQSGPNSPNSVFSLSKLWKEIVSDDEFQKFWVIDWRQRYHLCIYIVTRETGERGASDAPFRHVTHHLVFTLNSTHGK